MCSSASQEDDEEFWTAQRLASSNFKLYPLESWRTGGLRAGLARNLERISLEQYLGLLKSNGFYTWDSVLEVAEDDLERMGFKRGDRRKLMRALATYRGHPISEPLAIVDKMGQRSQERAAKWRHRRHLCTISDDDVRVYQINLGQYHGGQLKRMEEDMESGNYSNGLGISEDEYRTQEEDSFNAIDQATLDFVCLDDFFSIATARLVRKGKSEAVFSLPVSASP